MKNPKEETKLSAAFAVNVSFFLKVFCDTSKEDILQPSDKMKLQLDCNGDFRFVWFNNAQIQNTTMAVVQSEVLSQEEHF